MSVRKIALLLAVAVAAGCSESRDDAGSAAAPDSAPAPAPEVYPDRDRRVPDQPDEHVPPATVDDIGATTGTGSLRVALPAEGTLTFKGFGPAAFGADAEQVRIAWGGDLGEASPAEPGGCHYLIPQPLGRDGYRIAFMVEGDRFARVDVRSDEVTAPGGGRIGMHLDEIRKLYGDRVAVGRHKYDPAGSVVRVTDADGGKGVLVFETDAGGRVDEWRIGVPPQVDYVEGCS